MTPVSREAGRSPNRTIPSATAPSATSPSPAARERAAHKAIPSTAAASRAKAGPWRSKPPWTQRSASVGSVSFSASQLPPATSTDTTVANCDPTSSRAATTASARAVAERALGSRTGSAKSALSRRRSPATITCRFVAGILRTRCRSATRSEGLRRAGLNCDGGLYQISKRRATPPRSTGPGKGLFSARKPARTRRTWHVRSH